MKFSPETSPPHPVLDIDAPKDLEASEATENSLTLIWRRPIAKFSLYRLVYVSADGRQVETTLPAGVITETLRDLSPGMLYTVTLTAERGGRKSRPATLSASTGEATILTKGPALSLANDVF